MLIKQIQQYIHQQQRTSLASLGATRYLILLMGIFAFYNDILIHINHATMKNQLKDNDCVYTFGVDSRWFQSTNNLAFTNNLNLISVILAILQMSLGIFMKGFNAIHFKRPLDFIFEFVPQIILILALFGWMDLLIISKWLFVKHITYIHKPFVLKSQMKNHGHGPHVHVESES